MNGRASVADATSPRVAPRTPGHIPTSGAAEGAAGTATERDRGRGTYLSLFSGVGGLDLAVEHLGYRCVGQVEIDEWCRSQLARHWPDVPRWGDVADLSGAAYSEGQRGRPQGPLPAGGPPTLICGGFPCQPVSHAGQRRGRADARWLWPEYARLVGELRPRIVVVENVPGLLSIDGGRAVSEVVGDLASMGYVGRHGTLRASDVGAPHRRERFFLVAYSEDIGRERSGAAWDGRAGLADGADAPDADLPRLEGRARPVGGGADERATRSHDSTAWGPYEPAIRRWERVMGPAPSPLDSGRLSADFVEFMMGLPPGWTEGKRNQRLKALGNAVVPQQAALALSLLGLEAVKA